MPQCLLIPFTSPSADIESLKANCGLRVMTENGSLFRQIVCVTGWGSPVGEWRSYRASQKLRLSSDKPLYGHLPETRARDYRRTLKYGSFKKRWSACRRSEEHSNAT